MKKLFVAHRNRDLWVEADKVALETICCAIKAQAGPGKKRKAFDQSIDDGNEAYAPSWSLANQRWNIR